MEDEAEQEFILFPSTDDDISTQGDGPLKKPLDIFTLFSDLNNPSNLAKELRQYGILKDCLRCTVSSCRKQLRVENKDSKDGFVWRCPGCRKKKVFGRVAIFLNLNFL